MKRAGGWSLEELEAEPQLSSTLLELHRAAGSGAPHLMAPGLIDKGVWQMAMACIWLVWMQTQIEARREDRP